LLNPAVWPESGVFVPPTKILINAGLVLKILLTSFQKKAQKKAFPEWKGFLYIE